MWMHNLENCFAKSLGTLFMKVKIHDKYRDVSFHLNFNSTCLKIVLGISSVEHVSHDSVAILGFQKSLPFQSILIEFDLHPCKYH